MNAKILTLTVFGDETDVRDVIHYTRSSTEMRSLMQEIATRRISADCSSHKEEVFRDTHAAVVAYARRLAHARGCWTYNSAKSVKTLDIIARVALVIADSIRQAICNFRLYTA